MLAKHANENEVELIDLHGMHVTADFPLRPINILSKLSRIFIHLFYIKFFNWLFPTKGEVFFNTSFNKGAISRDLMYMKQCVKYDRSFSVFIHGWAESFILEIEGTAYEKKVAHHLSKARVVWVLADDFKNKLVKWGIDEALIKVETTMVDETLLPEFNCEEKERRRKSRPLSILFLSRIVKEKGIYEAIEAFGAFQEGVSNSEFRIAGTGPELENVKRYVKQHKYSNIIFVGFVSGEDKQQLLVNSDILLFPSYSEGMPIAIMEAMAFGCAIITRRVGGLKDFFQHGKMGYITDSLDPVVFREFLIELSSNQHLIDEIGRYNYKYAQNHLLSSVVTGRILNELEAG
jgi:glycosyltransferase involved in cell wall biosynthesis